MASIAIVEKHERFESVRDVRCNKFAPTRKSFAIGKEVDGLRGCLKMISRCWMFGHW